MARPPRPEPVIVGRTIRKRRWWRVDGPQDDELPKGWTYAEPEPRGSGKR